MKHKAGLSQEKGENNNLILSVLLSALGALRLFLLPYAPCFFHNVTLQ